MSTAWRYFAVAPTPFNLADVGEGIAECEIIKWHVEEGQQIQQFDMICEVQSDKATAEITSPYDGVITKIHYAVGDMAKVGKPLVDIRIEGEGAETQQAEELPVDASLPTLNTHGDHETQFQTIQTRGGPLKVRRVRERTFIPSGSFLTVEKVLATPAVRRIAREHNIDLSQVAFSGKEGRVLKEDILSYLANGRTPISKVTEKMPISMAAPALEKVLPVTASTPSYQLEDQEVPIKGIRKVMVKSMTAACQIPHFGYCEEMIINELKELRSQMKPIALERGIKLSYLPFLIKACSLALKE